MPANDNALAGLPKMDRLLASDALARVPWQREVVRRVATIMLDALRTELRTGALATAPDADLFAASVAAQLEAWSRPRPQRVINATGVVLHTNLGRAPWSGAAIDAAVAAAGACDLEIDLDRGVRGSRLATLRPLLAAVIGAPDVHVVNNNAAALLLACTVLGGSGGVALSHGQMVEIGDGFRVATMAAAGGCRVVGVGSTNRTHLADYEAALDGESAVSAILWVHLSNFEQRGYVADVELAALAKLARTRGVPLVADAGSGSLGGVLPDCEPTLAQYVERGADVVLASGDKLLGGPQAGIIAGGAGWIERIRRHPLARALRPDKTTIAALHATALAHARTDGGALPVYAMTLATLEMLRDRARVIADRIGADSSTIVDAAATLGGGSMPGETMPSIALRIVGDASALSRRLRIGTPAIVGRIDDGAVWIDLRTVAPEDDDALARGLAAAIAGRW